MENNVRPFGELFAEPPRNGLTRPKAVRGEGIKMVNMGELFAYQRLRNIPMDRVPLSESEADRFLLYEGDLLFARQSLVLEGAGKCSIFLQDDEPVTFESHVTRIRLDPCQADSQFYFYYLQSPHGQAAIRSIVEQGAGASGIRGSDLKTIEVFWMPMNQQRAIAHILGTLDDKIELNRRMNETLEAMARAIFKSWFVDFDPVRAKAEGRDTGLPKEIADLFPDGFEETELGEIPKGWHVLDVYHIADVIYGSPFKSALFNEEQKGIPLIRIRDLATHAPSTFTTENHPRGYLVKPGDLVVGMDGEFSAHLWRGPEAWLNQRLCCFKPKVGVPRAFVHYSIESLLDFFERSKTGTTVIHLGKSDIDTFNVLVPSDSILKSFNSIVDNLDARIVNISQESRALAELRDTLLPKLISGELRIDNTV